MKRSLGVAAALAVISFSPATFALAIIDGHFAIIGGDAFCGENVNMKFRDSYLGPQAQCSHTSTEDGRSTHNEAFASLQEAKVAVSATLSDSVGEETYYPNPFAGIADTLYFSGVGSEGFHGKIRMKVSADLVGADSTDSSQKWASAQLGINSLGYTEYYSSGVGVHGMSSNGQQYFRVDNAFDTDLTSVNALLFDELYTELTIEFDWLPHFNPVEVRAWTGLFTDEIGYEFANILSESIEIIVPEGVTVTSESGLLTGTYEVAVPAPATFGLAALGLMGLFIRRKARS